MDFIETEHQQLASQTKVYFTQEVIQALGIEGDVILRYHVYDFPVQLYSIQHDQMRVIIEAGNFFQKTVSSTSEREVRLHIYAHNKEFAADQESVTIGGMLVSVDERHIEKDGETHLLVEVLFTLDDTSLSLIQRVLTPIIRVMHEPQADQDPTLVLRDAHLRSDLFSLPHCALYLNQDDLGMRFFPVSFHKQGLTFLLKEDSVSREATATLVMVILEHHLSIRVAVEIHAIEEKGDGLVVCSAHFIDKPPIGYYLFLDKLRDSEDRE
ncbi:PilZN3 domain-containing protein [Entomospira culicis]|uniref:PilZN3 domain-containing protein n=1 Tax=Entomospira culicis TaxID=2719989 RepID=A0A968KZS8_9SPIO|nr:hypothetical protein [Entomospira culicis]NIZ19459.1 hypothetical protein [Entomospira culicis]NIZ69636.1 hypothetical protein [Entomospira culicis]WDI36747.1 hypothetical protein PVA46_05320 [Entomospira culicis]WDI38376.1 hypothetical protein PVA47_05330 [Entomospira culicis]